MLWLILGDVHGQWFSVNKLLDRALIRHPDITRIIQVGDLGINWPEGYDHTGQMAYSKWNVAESVRNAGIPVHWVDGNHENFGKLEEYGGSGNPDVIHQPRGSVLEVEGVRVMFFGGAFSIDHKYRVPGVSIWPQETIKRQEIELALKQKGPFDALFTHDRPDQFPCPFSGDNPEKDLGGRADRVALDMLWDKYSPSFWFFGHYHDEQHGYYRGTDWTLCPMIGYSKSSYYTLWDGKSVYRSWIPQKGLK